MCSVIIKVMYSEMLGGNPKAGTFTLVMTRTSMTKTVGEDFAEQISYQAIVLY